MVPFLLGVALAAAFVVRALRIENPLSDVRLYVNNAFAAASPARIAGMLDGSAGRGNPRFDRVLSP